MDVKTIAHILRLRPELQELQDLDRALQAFRANPHASLDLKPLLQGLGISFTALAERMGLSRSAIADLVVRAQKESVSIKTLKAVAEQLDCEFMYAFIPKSHETFSEIVTERSLPFVQRPELRGPAGRQRDMAAASRITKLLASPTGRAQIWGSKKALKRKFRWTEYYGRLR